MLDDPKMIADELERRAKGYSETFRSLLLAAAKIIRENNKEPSS